MTHVSDKTYRDFAHTVRVVTARAIIADEMSTVVPLAAKREIGRFTVVRRAAATTGLVALPVGEISAQGGQLGVTFATAGDTVVVTLQLKGFATLKAFARKSGRFVTPNGAVDAPFTFDARGTATCSFADTLAARVGVQAFDVIIEA